MVIFVWLNENIKRNKVFYEKLKIEIIDVYSVYEKFVKIKSFKCYNEEYFWMFFNYGSLWRLVKDKN